MTEERLSELIARKLSGEATGDELQELQEHLQLHPEDTYLHELVSGWWNHDKDNTVFSQRVPEDHFNYILQQATQQEQDAPGLVIDRIFQRSRIAYLKYGIAAACIALLVGSMLYVHFSQQELNNFRADNHPQKNEIVARKGSKSKLVLPDGSQVWLNSDTRLSYDSDFNDSLREVILDGEAYFDVVKNPKRPFIVHTSGISIRVLGTAFNVKSYSTEPVIEATLVRGLIEVQRNSEPHASRILLRPNEKLIYSKPQEQIELLSETKGKRPVISTSSSVQPQRIEISSIPRNLADSIRLETSWIYGKLLFEGDRFSELAVKMERWFNVKMEFKDSRVANYRFRGVFVDENIDEALQALQLTNSFNYEIKGNEVIITRK